MQSHIGETAFPHGPTAPDLTEKVRAESGPIFERQPGCKMRTSVTADDGTRISYTGWDSTEAWEQAQETVRAWGEANVRPRMSNVEVHEGEVTRAVRKG